MDSFSRHHDTDKLMVAAVMALHEEARRVFSEALQAKNGDVCRISGSTLAATVSWLAQHGVDT